MAPNADKNNLTSTIAKPFKQRKSFDIRKGEVAGIRAKFPTKIPVVVERYQRETSLPLLDKTKFLVPQELTMSNFTQIIRNRLNLPPGRSFYFVINNKSIISNSKPIAEIYRDNKDEDGFLYMTYASQEMFGSGDSSSPVISSDLFIHSGHAIATVIDTTNDCQSMLTTSARNYFRRIDNNP